MSAPANALAGKRLIITGAHGFVGSTILDAASHQPCEIIALGRQIESDWSPSGTTAKISYQARDVRDASAWDLVDDSIDFILHLASVETHQKSASVQDETDTNVGSVLSLLNQVASLPRKPKVIFTSSTNVFGAGPGETVDENSSDHPPSDWSRNKVRAEDHLRAFRSSHDIGSVILRLPNIYGLPARKSVTGRSSVNAATAACVRERKLVVYPNSNCLRDYLYVTDVSSMILAAVDAFDRLKEYPKVIIGSGVRTRIIDIWNEIARQYSQQSGVRVKINSEDRTMDDFTMRSYFASNALFLRETNYRVAPMSLQDGIAETVRHFITLSPRR